ncbi:hypothetical protein AVEN_14727-1 [Araneus ventricosus]|uniref:Integrase zinc-binding domain-containing protein n=1 Tax=Araneus ventricosus TaxID=182803 RepID=A0A4Y2TWG7_ARAVE|nr:hypothetical protein AVEN_14727-1 [Araneus ventricosus]
MKNLEARLESVHAFARERIKLASEQMKTRYDSRATDHHFKEGDLVWMYNPKRRRVPSPKLQHNWEGPYTVCQETEQCCLQRTEVAHHQAKSHPYCEKLW